MRPWLLLLAALSATAPAAEYTGSVNKVVDGDTFWLCDDTGRYKFRVCGINAPERGKPGYAESKAGLATVVKGKPVLGFRWGRALASAGPSLNSCAST